MPIKKTKIQKALKNKKPIPKPKNPKNTDRAKPVSFKEAEEMFDFWLELELGGNGRGIKGGGIRGVAKHFGRDSKTVLRIAKKHKWNERFAKIQDKIKAATDRKIVKKEVSNLDIIKALFNKGAKQLLRPNDLENLKLTDVVHVGRFYEELLGNITATESVNDDAIQMTPEQTEKALKLLENIDDKTIQLLGKMISEESN